MENKFINLYQLKDTYFEKLSEELLDKIIYFLEDDMQGGVEDWSFYETWCLNAYGNYYYSSELAHVSLRDTYNFSSDYSDDDCYTHSDYGQTDNNTDDDVNNIITDVHGHGSCEKMNTLKSQFSKCVQEKNKNWVAHGKSILKKMFMYDRILILAALEDCHLFRFNHHSTNKALRFVRMASYFRGRIFQFYNKSWITFVATMVGKQHWDNENFVIYLIMYYSSAFIIFASRRLKSSQSFFEKCLHYTNFPYGTVIFHATRVLRNDKKLWEKAIPYMSKLCTDIENQEPIEMSVNAFDCILGRILTPELCKDYDFCRNLMLKGIAMRVLWNERYYDDLQVAYTILDSDIGFSIFSQLSERLRGDIKLAEIGCKFYDTEVYLNCTDDIRDKIGQYVCQENDVVEKNRDRFLPSRQLMKKCVQHRLSSIKVFPELCDDSNYLMTLVSRDPMVYCYFPETVRSDIRLTCCVLKEIEEKRYKTENNRVWDMIVEAIPKLIVKTEHVQKYIDGANFRYDSVILPYEKHIKWTKRLINIHQFKNEKDVEETALFILFKLLKVNHKDYFQKDVQCHVREHIVDPLVDIIPSLVEHDMVKEYFVENNYDILNVQPPIMQNVLSEVLFDN